MNPETRQIIETACKLFYKAWYTEPTKAEQDYYKNYFGADTKAYNDFYNSALSPRILVYATRYDYTDYNDPIIYKIPQDIEKLRTELKRIQTM